MTQPPILDPKAFEQALLAKSKEAFGEGDMHSSAVSAAALLVWAALKEAMKPKEGGDDA